jgi:hypothetical protein
MPKYIILRRKKDDPKIHTPGSLEETACEIVNDCFRLSISKEQLMALPADGAAATMALLNGDAICSIALDKKRQKIWLREVNGIGIGIQNLNDVINRFENDLNEAFFDLKRKISNSSSFNDILNGGAISVYSSIGDTDVDDLNNVFQERIHDVFELNQLLKK